MRIMKKILRIVKFLKILYKEKTLVRSLLESRNVVFVKFWPPGHFYSPIPDLHSIDLKSTNIFDTSTKDIPSIKFNKDAQIQLAKAFSKLYSDLPFSDEKVEQLRYFLDNQFYSYGDGIILYSFLRHFIPKRIIEIGSGYSSVLMLDTNDLFLKKTVDFTFIEPFPERLLSLLSESDQSRVKIEKKYLQDVKLTTFESLEANDILFVDSSHVAKINSDVLYIIFEILPRLKKGVIIHFHDILWPFEYPKAWLKGGRAWNEAYFLRAFLQNNAAFEILYFNSYMALHQRDMVKEMMPKILNIPTSKVTPGNTSLWLRKTL